MTTRMDGNLALTGEIDLTHGYEFTLGVSFGRSRHAVGAALFQSLCIPFATNVKSFVDQWSRTRKRLAVIDMNRGKVTPTQSSLFARSINLLLAHEDKIYPGAMIASMSIPWGEDKGDDELGGYHLVWTRDMVHSADALMAAGDTTTPLRAMIYLAIAQNEDGGFYQNFWIDGRPYWTGVQLDEVSFPIMLAWRLWKANALGEFDPHITISRACTYLIRKGPATAEERWEEAGGYSPSTLASNIAALICAGRDVRSARRSSTRPTFCAPTQISSSRTWRNGRSPIRAAWYRGFAATTSASIPRSAAKARSATRIPTRANCAWRTRSRAIATSIPPTRSSMPASWNWCASAFASPAIR